MFEFMHVIVDVFVCGCKEERGRENRDILFIYFINFIYGSVKNNFIKKPSGSLTGVELRSAAHQVINYTIVL